MIGFYNKQNIIDNKGKNISELLTDGINNNILKLEKSRDYISLTVPF